MVDDVWKIFGDTERSNEAEYKRKIVDGVNYTCLLCVAIRNMLTRLFSFREPETKSSDFHRSPLLPRFGNPR